MLKHTAYTYYTHIQTTHVHVSFYQQLTREECGNENYPNIQNGAIFFFKM